MTADDWLCCSEPEPMLAFQRGKLNDRKLRLFASSCVRSIWHLLNDLCRDVVEVGERFADGSATVHEFCDAEVRVAGIARTVETETEWAAIEAARAATWLVQTTAWEVALETSPWVATAAIGAGRQADLLRDIVGNPFHPVAINPLWLTPTATNLAEAAYQERILPCGEFDRTRLAVLADALEETGCENGIILDHLRGPGPHVRGCWVVDLVLDKQ